MVEVRTFKIQITFWQYVGSQKNTSGNSCGMSWGFESWGQTSSSGWWMTIQCNLWGFSMGRYHDTVGVGTIQALNVRQDWDIPWFLQSFGGRELDDTPGNKHMSPKKSRSDGFKKGGGGPIAVHLPLVFGRDPLKANCIFLLVFLLIEFGIWTSNTWLLLGWFWWVFQSWRLLGGTTTLENPPKNLAASYSPNISFCTYNGGTHLYKFFLWGFMLRQQQTTPQNSRKKRLRIPPTEVSQPAVTDHGLATNSVFDERCFGWGDCWCLFKHVELPFNQHLFSWCSFYSILNHSIWKLERHPWTTWKLCFKVLSSGEMLLLSMVNDH